MLNVRPCNTEWNGQLLQYLLIREWNTGVNQYHCWQLTRNAGFALLLFCVCSVNKKSTVYLWIFFYRGNSCSFTIICYLAVTAPCHKVKGHGRIVLAIKMQQQLQWSLMCSKADTFNIYLGRLERLEKSVLLKVKQQWGQWCVINWNLINAVLTLVLLQRIATTSWILQLVRTSILLYVKKNQTLQYHSAPKTMEGCRFQV